MCGSKVMGPAERGITEAASFTDGGGWSESLLLLSGVSPFFQKFPIFVVACGKESGRTGKPPSHMTVLGFPDHLIDFHILCTPPTRLSRQYT